MYTLMNYLRIRDLNKKVLLRTNTILILCIIIFSFVGCNKGDSNSSTPAEAFWNQQGNKLVGTGAIGNAMQGNSISLSGDGSTVFFTGYTDNSNLGAAWTFSRSNGTWVQQGGKLTGSGTSGKSLQAVTAVSLDGNTALVGGSNDNSTKGAVWVFIRNNGSWMEQAKLIANGGVPGDYFGTDVAISSDGNTAVVGSYNGANAGGVWVFTRSNGTWTQQGNKLVGSGAVGASNQGKVAISTDGNTLAIGGFTDNNNAGAVWVFTRSNGTWTQQGNKLVGSGAVGNAYQGSSISISSDGNTLAVGSKSDNNNAGAVWVFTRSNGTWTQQGNKLVGSGAVGNAAQGAVAISGDANTLAIGGSGDNGGKGAVWVFTRSNGTWTQKGSKLVATDAVGIAWLGGSVSVNSDGTTIATGGASDDGQKGAVWIFKR